MESSTATRIAKALWDQHPEVSARLENDLWGDVERTLRLLPEGGTWAIARPSPAVFARGDDGTLFVLAVDVEHGQVRMTSRRVDSTKIAVGFEWERGTFGEGVGRVTRKTRWSFRFEDADEDLALLAHIEGRVTKTGADDPGELDRPEQLARAIASGAGWQFETQGFRARVVA